MTNQLKHGDIARWKDAFVTDDSERGMLFIVLEPADDGRCLIRPVEWDRRQIAPTMLTSIRYLDKVS